jgi:hypothetical protein
VRVLDLSGLAGFDDLLVTVGARSLRSSGSNAREADAMGTIRPNRVKQKLAAGQTAVCLSGIDSPELVD